MKTTQRKEISRCFKYLLTLVIFLSIAFTNISKTTAVELENISHPNLDFIAVNNEVIEKKKEAVVSVKVGDAVKIAGIGIPNDAVKITFNSHEYSTTVDENGNWFVLFSVQDIERGSYPVELQFNEKAEGEKLTVLKIEEGDTVEVAQTESIPKEKNIDLNIYLLVVIFVPLSLVLGWILRVLFEKKSSKLKGRGEND
ncbi:MAG: hypothetical protein RBT33_03150 [Candidatus Dojkabacteria bacterium]|jgi:ribosomal protein S17|nr:hypothetical protein [Candidatus Dojkabacteria bacterium]